MAKRKGFKNVDWPSNPDTIPNMKKQIYIDLAELYIPPPDQLKINKKLSKRNIRHNRKRLL